VTKVSDEEAAAILVRLGYSQTQAEEIIAKLRRRERRFWERRAAQKPQNPRPTLVEERLERGYGRLMRQLGCSDDFIVEEVLPNVRSVKLVADVTPDDVTPED
jgi:hypothetical protein